MLTQRNTGSRDFPMITPVLSLHPALRLGTAMLFILAVQCLTGPLLLVVGLLPTLAGVAVLRRWWRLAYRTRWLLLSLLLVMAFSLAGEPAWGGSLPAPSMDGLREALVQGGRLLVVLGIVATLLETTPLPMLMAGCLGLMRPLQFFGVDSDRIVARLMLTLHYAETLPSPRHWRELLVSCGLNAGPEGLALPQVPLSLLDRVFLLFALLVVIGITVTYCAN